MAVLALVLFRLVWGFTGNRYARFGSFVTGPGSVLRYAASLFSPAGSQRHVGHNPLGGYVVLVMLALILLQAGRSEEHTSELQSLMRISYAVFCLQKNNTQ